MITCDWCGSKDDVFPTEPIVHVYANGDRPEKITRDTKKDLCRECRTKLRRAFAYAYRDLNDTSHSAPKTSCYHLRSKEVDMSVISIRTDPLRWFFSTVIHNGYKG